MNLKKINELLEDAMMAESGMDYDKKISHIADLTDKNNHTEAYVETAMLLGLKAFEDKFKLLLKINQLEGEMPKGVGDYQYELLKKMMDYAKKKLPSNVYEKLDNSL